nr:nucleotidyl transferase AbiEii/AbiGii toxin family protein [Variovorax beijingensis]
MSRNLAASIRARLKQRADATKQDFNLTLTHYGLERLLYRLSVSPHAANYLLKGALLFSLWYDQPHRPTRDADLLGFGPDISTLPWRPSARSARSRWRMASHSILPRSTAR